MPHLRSIHQGAIAYDRRTALDIYEIDYDLTVAHDLSSRRLRRTVVDSLLFR